MINAPVLTSFANSRQSSQQELEWNLMATPLVCGSLSIMDNVLLDNERAMWAFSQDHVIQTMRKYSQAGLFQLYHRARGKKVKKVNQLSDILLDWLTTPNNELGRVGFGMLKADPQTSKDPNDELRRLIKGLNDKGREDEYRLGAFYEFMKEYHSGYESYINTLESFFKEHENGRTSYEYYPGQIQYRVLEILGYPKNPKEFLYGIDTKEGGHGNLLRDELLKNLKGFKNSVFKKDELLEVFEDESLAPFFELLSLYEKDPTLTGLLDAIESSSSKFKTPLQKVIKQVYLAGIPSANSKSVILEQEPESYEVGEYVDFKKLAEGIGRLGEEEIFMIRDSRLWQSGKVTRDSIEELKELVFDRNRELVKDEVMNGLGVVTKKYDRVLDLFFKGASIINSYLQEGSVVLGHSIELAEQVKGAFTCAYTPKLRRSEQRLYANVPGNFVKNTELLIKRLEYVEY
ncbi:hypothetical protein [uncultured Roseivirga sp.]|uniref:hypothetical protein n=1 Tax=uncultured Roseivirga sp. TaxID=543088 RepID=UPI000D78DF5E|nr:hypothetical protein [uncultured Roseivirga sp.]PWL28390.1 MAG: hypothetical protein DCO95_13540 [Roseivirga sp. XM-24bin3]